ncbi:hypothetical protein [Streptomyces adustus]|uniref:hypothetical protein n=1 Tax=Streptomyces adustus TaxID=1609272 RepID=UPI00371A1E91
MRLRTACPAPPGTWTVELRPHPDGLALVCRQCPHTGRQVAAVSARSAALAHLARHARSDLRPPHLRTCQCRERGCRWHPRHRGCNGPIRLLLACEHGGRIWRLADTCTACAAATDRAAVVPDTALAPAPQPALPRRRRRPRGPDERTRVGDMLSYLAATLPADSPPSARLLALQCALRVDDTLHVRLPRGVLRSLRLDAPQPWRDLEQANWLRTVTPSASRGITARLLDAALLSQAPARPDRCRAADCALRMSRPSRTGAGGPLQQLTLTCLGAHTDPSGSGWGEPDRMARACGLSLEQLPALFDQLATAGLLAAWRGCPNAENLYWTL